MASRRSGLAMSTQLDQIDEGRSLWADIGWRALQVFIATMLVEVSATDILAAARSIKFWEDVIGATLVAVLSQVLALASSRAGIPPPVRGDGTKTSSAP